VIRPEVAAESSATEHSAFQGKASLVAMRACTTADHIIASRAAMVSHAIMRRRGRRVFMGADSNAQEANPAARANQAFLWEKDRKSLPVKDL
jgi:hypothetical protein